MSIITRMLKQKAVYWPFASIDSFGKKVVGSPVQIKVRWEDVSEEFLDGKGERQLSNALVYVDRDVTVGGILMLGTSADVDASGFDTVNIKENDGAWEIRRFDKLPDLKARRYLRSAYL